MKNIFFILALALVVFSCNKVKETTKNTINQGGEIVGQTATNFIDGVSKGVDKTLNCKITLSKELVSKGLKTGVFSIDKDSVESKNNNKIILYLVFEKDFNATIKAKVFNENNLESGRTTIKINGKSGEAGYFNISFDPRTNIESKSKIILE
jgi:hypothetical protein